MRNRPFDGLTGDRPQRHHYFAGASDSRPPGVVDPPNPTGKSYMLLEDFRLFALPYGVGGGDGFSLALEPDSMEVVELVTNAIPSRFAGLDRLPSAFREYVGSAIWRLVQGDLHLEIEYFREESLPVGTPVAFRIAILDSDLVHQRWGRLFYWTPAAHASTGDVAWTRERLDPGALVSVSVPRALRQSLRRALDVLRAADRDLDAMHSFALGKYGADSGFDLTTYRRISNDTVLRATREIGWTGRGLLTEDLLDPMKVWRAIQFARVVVQLRDIAIAGLQEAINRAGVRVGFDATIALTGVLTEANLDQLEADLRAGTRPIGEMLIPKPPTQAS